MMQRHTTRTGWLALGLLLVSSVAVSLERPESTQPAQNYLLFCAGCHGLNATGVPHKVPALTKTLPLFIGSEEGRDFLLRVPGVANSALSDQGLAAVLNWLIATLDTPTAHWDDFVADDVRRARQTPLMSVAESRRQIVSHLRLSKEIADDVNY
jgi:hypothetical protein